MRERQVVRHRMYLILCTGMMLINSAKKQVATEQGTNPLLSSLLDSQGILVQVLQLHPNSLVEELKLYNGRCSRDWRCSEYIQGSLLHRLVRDSY
jgi:hypothetical protein